MRHASWLIISADAVIVLLHTTDQTTWEAKNKDKFKAFKRKAINKDKFKAFKRKAIN